MRKGSSPCLSSIRDLGDIYFGLHITSRSKKESHSVCSVLPKQTGRAWPPPAKLHLSISALGIGFWRPAQSFNDLSYKPTKLKVYTGNINSALNAVVLADITGTVHLPAIIHLQSLLILIKILNDLRRCLHLYLVLQPCWAVLQLTYLICAPRLREL